MKVNIIARHFDISEKTRNYIQTEVDERLDPLFDRIVDCRMIVEKEKNNYIAQVILNVPGDTLTAKETTEDLTKSVDFVVKKMLKQLNKYKDKWKKPAIDPDKEI
ncbi:MAG: ribosome-associated translation inhibitor RaiA [Candidatus Marinimicrobia bacterium]|nr:ribosome-associated translation inhibitor RaiA [Candidatus Neomarinimicrobiota bacterium]MCF7851139.1 ribosome-associated translation inhibitor RaiA [Candidatus Neomarinimicrobiota bacterium]MCF7904056.1 ribosome-associated translation inhibitor RaiA [Candidatus Neomarinimicrobiota bacterium]